MSSAARATFQGTRGKGHKRWAHRRQPESVVRLSRACRAANVYSEIAKSHITHPLPEQLMLAEKDLRAALDEMQPIKLDRLAPMSQLRISATPSMRERYFLAVSASGFWAMMVLQALQYFQVF